MYKNKKATILIYILILISIVMIMAVVVLNNSVMLENALSYQTIKSDLSNKIKEKWDLLTSYNILINSDWGGFVDNISCPDNIIMSWSSIFSSWIEIERAHSGTTHFCSWTYNSIILNVFPNSDNTSFTWATWWPDTVAFSDTLSSLVWIGNFPTYDSWTYITIPKDSFLKPDWIDDDFNNDNYNWD